MIATVIICLLIKEKLSLCLRASLTLTTFTHKTHCHKKIKVNKINLKVKFVLLSERSRTYGPKNRKLSISTIGSLKGRIPPRCYRAKPHQPKFADTDWSVGRETFVMQRFSINVHILVVVNRQ